jgi:hypothetical protein
MGGYAGYRYLSVYKNKTELKKLNPPNPDPACVILAQGISRDEAEDLVAQTPEICILTSAIHELCDNKEGRISDGMADIFLARAFVTIERNRNRRQHRNINPAVKWHTIQLSSENDEKTELYRHVKVMFGNRYGLVGNLHIAKGAILYKINSLINRR